MKKILFLFIFTILLTSCKPQDQVKKNEKAEKKDFFVEVKEYWVFWKQLQIKKSWKILPFSILNLSSKVNWQVSEILIKEWDTVKKWQVLAKLKDNIWNYNLKLQRAQNAISSTRLNLKSKRVNLDKAIRDAKLNLKKVRSNFEIAKKDAKNTIKNSEKKLEKIKLNLSNTNLSNKNWKSSLDIEKTKKSLKKQKLDYENKLQSDNETINSFIETTKEKYINLKTINDDILEFADELLGVSDLNDRKNNSFEDFLGAKDSQTLFKTKNKLRILLKNKDIIKDLNIKNLSEDNLISKLNKLSEIYKNLIDLLDNLEHILNYSVNSISFTSTQINSYITQINSYQATINWQYTRYVSFKSQVSSFLNTYKEVQKSMKKWIEIMEKDIKILETSLQTQEENSNISYEQSKNDHIKTALWLKDKLNNFEILIENAENTLQNAKENKEITLSQLQNSLNKAKIAYSEALDLVNKLTIKSPIDWQISKVNVNLWQDVFSNNIMFEMIEEDQTEIETSFSLNELKFIEKWKNVKLKYLWNIYTGEVYTISNLANNNLSYSVKVKLKNNVQIFGDVIELIFDIKTKNVLLPVNIVNVKWENTWILNIYKNWEIEKKEVKLWNIYNNKIVVLTELKDDTKIITSNIENYEKINHNVKLKK